MAHSHPLRLTPLPADEWDERARAALSSLIPAERANPTGAGNVLSTMVRHPDLTRAYLPFNSYLLRDSTLSARIREVALLRVVHLADCEYLWSHHIPLAKRAGMSAEDIDALGSGGCSEPLDSLVVRAVDDLVTHHTVTPSTWEELGREFSDEQRMDLVFTIGGYLLLAIAVNTFGVQEEQG
jgi:alkylhydroperoxidase family enzyme